MKKSLILLNIFVIALFFSCDQNEKVKAKTKIKKVQMVRIQPKSVAYQMENAKEWLSVNNNDSIKLGIAYAINRTDKENFAKMDSVIVPIDMDGDLAYYLPFPLNVSYLKDIDKIIYFSYPSQTFDTY